MTKHITVSRVFLSALVLLAVVMTAGYVHAQGDYLDCIQNNENKKGDPSIKNKYGFVGLYQMGVPAMIDSGMCNQRAGKPYPQTNNWDNCDFSGPLAKRLGLPPGKAGYDAFTTGPNAAAYQRAAAQSYSDVKWNRMTRNKPKILDYVGKSYQGVMITKESILAISHLLGEGGVYDFLLRNVNGRDANGTSGSGYAICFMQCLQGTGDGNCKFDVKKICT